MSRFVSALLALLLAGPAIAQPNPQFNQTQTYQSFTPTGRATDLSATTATSRVALGSSAGVAWVCNTGATNTVYVQLGTVTVVAVVASSFPIPAGRCAALNSTGATHIAGITASSTTTVQTVLGTGSPGAALGTGGGGGGGSGTVTSVSVVTANGLAGSVATATSTPAITLSTSVTGNVCGNATALSACTTTGTGSTVLAVSPTLTGVPIIPTPFTLGAVSVTSTGTQLNYLNAATGTTGTTSTNVVFSTSPTLVTPALGAATATSLAVNGATIGSNALAVTGQVTNTGGTITTSQPFTISQTWNAGGVTFNSVLLDITATASATASTLADFKVAAGSVFAVLKTGSIYFNGATQTTPLGGVGITGPNGSSLHIGAINGIAYIGRTEVFGADIQVGLVGVKSKSTGVYGFSVDTTSFGTLDTNISRNAAGIIQFGTTAANAAGSLLALKGTFGDSGGFNVNAINMLSGSGTSYLAVNGQGVLGFSGGVTAAVFSLGFVSATVTSGPDIFISRNTAGVAQFGTTAANALGSWLAVNGTLSGALVVSGTADASAVTGSGALQVAGGASIAKRLWIPAITASAGLQTAVLCQSSGGEMIADSVACLASSERFKTILGSAETGALDKLMRLPIYRWKYNEEGIFKSDEWTRERIGPTAEETAAIDPRLVGYGSDGKIRNVSTEQLLSLTIQAIQELKADNDNLRETIIKRAANGG